MNNLQSRANVKSELDRLTMDFFRSVTLTPGSAPDDPHIHTLFIEQGLLIKNVTPTPEISTVSPFIAPRHEGVQAGEAMTPAWKSAMALAGPRSGAMAPLSSRQRRASVMYIRVHTCGASARSAIGVDEPHRRQSADNRGSFSQPEN
ncbi:MAG: hypothetical protein MUF08_07585 [Burkholderiaceae bacterium]|nr:hypothetical protein [Burkholderiaceae bacterium]